MSDIRNRLEQERDRLHMPGDAFDRLRRRRDRKRRSQRLASAVVALVVFAAGMIGLVATLRGAARPAHHPTPTPTNQSTGIPTPRVAGPLVASLPPVGAATFVDASRGWLAGTGVILGTDDGGRRWHLVYSTKDPRASFQQVDFVDAEHGWALATATTGPGELLRTVDGGRRWTVVGEPSGGGPLARIDFVSTTTGWGVADTNLGGPTGGSLVSTADGGVTWTAVPTSLRNVDDVCFADAMTGWAAGGNTVLRTADGGRSWRTAFMLSLPGAGGAGVPQVRCAGRAAYVLFHEGAAAGNEAYVVERTLDGGATWAPILANLIQGPPFQGLPRIDVYSGPFFVLDALTADFVGQCQPCGNGTASLATTTDGGATVERRQAPSGGQLAAATFADPLHGWIVVRSFAGPERAFATFDGGRTWTQVFPGTA